MKATISVIISLLCCLGINAKGVKEYFDTGNPIEYCGTEYYLAWSDKDQDSFFLQEYLPKGESLDHFNQMVTVWVLFIDAPPPLDAIKYQIMELEQNKKTDPIIDYKVTNYKGEYILEFIVSDSDKGELSTVELNIQYYKQMTINGKNATVLCYYACRAYGDDIKPFIQSIPEKRNALYEGMINLDINPKFNRK